MNFPLFYPTIEFAASLPEQGHSLSIQQLCEENQIPCKFTGFSAQRKIHLKRSKRFLTVCEPFQGSVLIETPWSPFSKKAKRYALAVMAYSVFDLVARESVRYLDLNRIAKRGRPLKGRTKTNAERQRAFRQRQSQTS